jgi:thiamine kinase-like enzyme
MEQSVLSSIAIAYGWSAPICRPVQSGLINHTWQVTAAQNVFLLQAINTQVFRFPELIDRNLTLLADYFQQSNPAYLFTAPVKTMDGKGLYTLGNETFRVFPWVTGSHTIDVVVNTHQASSAAMAFGRFTALSTQFDCTQLGITLPEFHHLPLRHMQFMEAVKDGNPIRVKECDDAIQWLQSQTNIVHTFTVFTTHHDVKQRVTHHDTKISNVLFDAADNSLCVIDLDTVMPGYFLSDVGDMFRTYVCPVSEEEQDLGKICIRKEYLQAIAEGYLQKGSMKSQLSQFELDHFYFAGEMMIYMQALRFMTDYLLNDRYYGKKYPTHNKVRAENQIRLLQLFKEAI